MKLTIIGCGLIGGSVALALKRRRPEWTVVCLDLPDRLGALREAEVCKLVGALDDAPQYLPQSDVVLLAVPVQAAASTLERIRPHLRQGAIVTDVGSTKGDIVAQAPSLLPTGVRFIGGHPMAGSERSGVEAADPLLFIDRNWILCPYPDTPPEALLTLMDLVESVQAKPVTMDAQEHDRMVAMVSHLPQLISTALMLAAEDEDATHSMLQTIAGRGFLDMTRLAASDYSMWAGILQSNRQAILDAVDRFIASLSKLRDAVTSQDAGRLWERASRRRGKLGPENLHRQRKTDLRGTIDRYDQQLVAALGQRMQAARKIGRIKKHQASAVVDPQREKLLLQQRHEWGNSLGLPPELIDELFAVILKHSSSIQARES